MWKADESGGGMWVVLTGGGIASECGHEIAHVSMIHNMAPAWVAGKSRPRVTVEDTAQTSALRPFLIKTAKEGWQVPSLLRMS